MHARRVASSLRTVASLDTCPVASMGHGAYSCEWQVPSVRLLSIARLLRAVMRLLDPALLPLIIRCVIRHGTAALLVY
ncbi:hypothetical protein HYPSUDRAFT_72243 [Hypholoma sublateritium FD-334 SS-4]|uniref:Uncharacterized protein n=1 Tax=Hypholoma sublateritium (strain FD-334 SS-4) TaxID=945553 RepID=A0A0D2KKG8_HYPSF|nr:hypothetical protein HYPSUDRAFT_72243 [Hypholoma sublateritium FD-334 SS-4]